MEDISNLQNDIQKLDNLKIQENQAIGNSDLRQVANITKEKEEVISRIMTYRNFIKTYSWVTRYLDEHKDIIFDFDKLLISKSLVSSDKALKFLQLDKKIYYKTLKVSPIKAIVFVRQHCEDLSNKLFEQLMDLNTGDNIGISGQRLAGIFNAVRNDIPIDARTASLKRLIETEDDIIKVITTFGDIALTYQSNNDVTLLILVSLENRILEKEEEIKKNDAKLSEIQIQIKEISSLLMEKRERLRELEEDIYNKKEEYKKVNSISVETIPSFIAPTDSGVEGIQESQIEVSKSVQEQIEKLEELENKEEEE